MEDILYNLMDWAQIEDIVYSESSRPHEILGAKKIEEGILIQCFFPNAKEVKLCLEKTAKEVDMKRQDDAGFFAVLLQQKTIPKYHYHVVYEYNSVDRQESYMKFSLYNDDDLDRFARGVHYDIFEKMGAHLVKVDGIEGVYFSVWAPEAMRISVVGDFNLWDGRLHQMSKIKDSGIWEIFIPGVGNLDNYKYEIKTMKGEPMLKADPYGFFSELRPDNASLVYDLKNYVWDDEDWLFDRDLKQCDGKNYDGCPINIYELHLGSWIRKERKFDENGEEIAGSEFYNYKEIAVKLAKYVKEMNYTHIELMPVMEHPFDGSWGYQVTGYYAPTSRYGTPHDFMYFVDYMHSQNIGVIIDWVPAHFPKDLHGLGVFDGTHVYEHADPRQGTHPHWGTYVYNYGRPQVSNFLIANAIYWAKYYHIDGIRMDAVASMLYLDYGRDEGQWVANKNGGHENLEAIEFLKHLNSIFKTRYNDVLLIAEESTAWPKISGELSDGGLGFDFKWNMGWMNDFLAYMQNDPYFRSYHYGKLTFSMLYQYSENFILVLSHDEVVHGKNTLLNKMPGFYKEDRLANLRVAYGFMMTHPGKKLLFMGQEFAQEHEWNEDKSIEWEILEDPLHAAMHRYVKDLNAFYKKNESLWKLDAEPEGFEWTNCYSYEENIIAFVRKSEYEEDDLLVVCNFTPVTYESFEVRVPYAASYKEVFNSDSESYGGKGIKNARAVKAVEDKEGKNLVIDIKIPPLSTVIFSPKVK